MQVTETLSEGLKREIKVVVEAKELGDRLSKRLDELKDQVRIKGFRPGKVPVAHLRRVYGRSVMAEIVQQTVNESSQKAITDREEKPAFEPKIALSEDQEEIEQIMEGKADLAFTLSFEVLPPIEISDISKISLERQVAEVTDEDVQTGIDRLAESSTTYKKKDGVAETGDQVTINFVGKIDGEEFEGGTAEDAPLVLGQNGFIPGFEDGLIGSKADDERAVEATFPEDYPVDRLAGKTAVFDVKIKEVAEAHLPDIDDDFAKSMGLENVEKLTEAVRGRISDEYKEASRLKLKRSLLDALDERHQLALPPTLVKQEFDAVWTKVTEDLKRADKTFEDEGTTEEKVRQKYQELAERRVRLGLVLSEIGGENEIQVSEEEVKRAILEQVRQYPGQEQQVFEFYKKNPQAVAHLRAPIFEDKVVDFLLELAHVEEKSVTAEELLSAPDEEADDEAGGDQAESESKNA